MSGTPVDSPIETGLLVIGSGIAGLFAALTAADLGEKVTLLTKAELAESNTRYAQGGIAAAIGPDDSAELHWRDTMSCGGELNDGEAVDTLTREAKNCIESLIDLGVEFDRSGPNLALGREAAHSVARVVHAGGDATGKSVQAGLIRSLRNREVDIGENCFVTSLLTEDGRVTGAEFVQDNHRRRIAAKRVLLATGGAGQVFSRTTNPEVATGDGLALAFNAGAELMDLEFFQFHPTAMALPGMPAFLISEAARGEGGVLRNAAGEAFMRRYHPDGDLAPRDVVARSIWREMQETNARSVALDLSHLGAQFLQSRFPTIWQTCLSAGLDISRQPIPIAPAAHYFMGGIRTDTDGRTSLSGLFAAGEAACTGVHGANRLASNSLLEGLVFGRGAALAPDRLQAPVEIDSSQDSPAWAESPRAEAEGSLSASDRRLLSRQELRAANWRGLGIVREQVGLRRILNATRQTHTSSLTVAEIETENIRLVSKLMASAALIRTESRGAHFRSDFPMQDERWQGHIIADRHGLRFWRHPMSEAALASA